MSFANMLFFVPGYQATADLQAGSQIKAILIAFSLLGNSVLIYKSTRIDLSLTQDKNYSR